MKKPKIFQELLKESFAAHKERTALEYGDERATYGRMDQMSDAVATAVLAENPGKETFIGIYTTNRLHLPAAVIGILKAGCVFVPLDPAHPRHRLELMAETAGLDFIIADGNQKEHFPGCMSASNPNLKILILDDILAAGGTPAALTYSPEDKIYVYFTSGT
ncbi:MAG: AMP-binding protein, partial [bacterium]|nr:AMP-binding protein [bacterium]